MFMGVTLCMSVHNVHAVSLEGTVSLGLELTDGCELPSSAGS